MNDRACSGVAGFDGKHSIDGGVSAFWGIEAEVGLAFFCVEPVAGKAVVAENGADIAVEIELSRRGGLADGGGRGEEEAGCEG